MRSLSEGFDNVEKLKRNTKNAMGKAVVDQNGMHSGLLEKRRPDLF